MTPRDIETLKFVAKIGFVEISHIARYIGVSEKRAYAITNRLIKAGELEKCCGMLKRQIYRVSKKFARENGFRIPTELSLTKYEHTIRLADLAIDLLNAYYQDYSWQSEQELIRDAMAKAGGFVDIHVPDLLFYKDNEKIAIELELTRKTQTRMEKVIKHYQSDFSYTKVIFFAPRDIANFILRMVGNDKLFEVRIYEIGS